MKEAALTINDPDCEIEDEPEAEDSFSRVFYRFGLLRGDYALLHPRNKRGRGGYNPSCSAYRQGEDHMATKQPVIEQDILDANTDLDKRVQRLDVTVMYDEEFDIFLLRFGPSQEAITEEVSDGLQLRLDPKTLRIVGLEVLGFQRRFLAEHPEFGRLYELLLCEHSHPIQKEIPHRPKNQRRTRAQEAVNWLLPLTPGIGSPRPA